MHELLAVAESIARVEVGVEAVETEIKEAKGAGDKVEVAALREKEKQLREEKKQLREEKKQLREKEKLLLERSGAHFWRVVP